MRSVAGADVVVEPTPACCPSAVGILCRSADDSFATSWKGIIAANSTTAMEQMTLCGEPGECDHGSALKRPRQKATKHPPCHCICIGRHGGVIPSFAVAAGASPALPRDQRAPFPIGARAHRGRPRMERQNRPACGPQTCERPRGASSKERIEGRTDKPPRSVCDSDNPSCVAVPSSSAPSNGRVREVFQIRQQLERRWRVPRRRRTAAVQAPGRRSSLQSADYSCRQRTVPHVTTYVVKPARRVLT